MARSKECELELVNLIYNPLLQNEGDIEAYVSKKRELDLELKHFRSIEDQCWQQKSCIQWLKEEDLNTSFFHRVDLGRLRGNLITPVMIPPLDDTKDVSYKQAVTAVFMDRFC